MGRDGNDWFNSGLPDFSWYNRPKREKYVPNEHRKYQMAIQYTNVTQELVNHSTGFSCQAVTSG
jgi:hypothetical protein